MANGARCWCMLVRCRDGPYNASLFYFHPLLIIGASFKLLRDGVELWIADWHKPVTILISEKGSGKSTVLECLPWLFRAL